MPGAERLFLDGDQRRRDGFVDVLALRADHDDGALDADGMDRVQKMEDHRPPGERMQDLGQDGFHPRALACGEDDSGDVIVRSEEHTSELQSLMRISYAVFCL